LKRIEFRRGCACPPVPGYGRRGGLQIGFPHISTVFQKISIAQKAFLMLLLQGKMADYPSVFKKVQELILPAEVERPLKVLFVAAEASPFAQVGGVGQVLFYLPHALRKLGVDARVFIPKYGTIDEEKFPLEVICERLKVPTGDPSKPVLICNIKYYEEEGGVPIYFLENMEYYEWRANVYGYADDQIRWALLDRGVLEFLVWCSKKRRKGIKETWVPDIIHCNDWHAGLIANLIETDFAKNPQISAIATVFTIHNIHFQGTFDHHNVSDLDFDDGKSPIPTFFDKRLKNLNFMRRGIMYSDCVNTVSETYSREILTKEYGEGLDGLLLELRSKLFGVVNGLDYEAFDPQTDNLLAANFDIDSIEQRKENKKALQKEFSLPQDENTCLLAGVSRLDPQKGLDLVVEVLPHLLRDFPVQFIFVGGGDLKYREALEGIAKKFPKQVGLHLLPNFTLPRLVFGGCDIFLLPSRFEPAGLTQLEAMRYGAVPIVRKTGGLADTVGNVDLSETKGTGFVFESYNPWAFYGTLVKAITLWHDQDFWHDLTKRVMSVDFSWEKSAENYIKLYRRAQDFQAGKFERTEEY
jgi:starch synthase